MKITDYRRSTIGLILGTVSNANAIDGVSFSSNTPPVAGTILVAISSNMAEWRDALSFGSNTNDVSSVGTMGSSPSNTRADHVHRGVHAIAHTSNTLYGDVTLVAGTGIGISTAGQSVRIDSTAGITAGTYFLASDGGQGVRGALGSVGATETIDLGNGLYQTLTLNANCTIDFTGWTTGTYCEVGLRLTENATGGWTPTFTGVTWVGGTTPTHDTTAATATEYRFWSDDGGGSIYGGQIGGASISYASNANQVSIANSGGAASTASRGDHVHRGVHSLSHTSNTFYGNVILTASGTLGITSPVSGTFDLTAGAGTGGGGGGGGIDSGTSNPGGPASGDLFFRTDLDFLITYDGTQWVTVQEYAIAGQPRVLIDGLSATSVNAVRYSVPTDYDIFVTLLDISTFVPTTNNGTNHWKVDLNKVDTANTVTSIGNVTTAADTSNVWTRHKITINASLAGATYPTLSVSLTKTSSPGNLFIASATLRYRHIVT